MVPQNLRYTSDHEWARAEGTEIYVGVTGYASEQLGDIVYVEVPQNGDDVTQGEPFGTIESTKSVSDLISPVTGVVVEGNTDLLQQPQIVNEDPYGDGWIMRMTPESMDELEELMSAVEYEEYIAELEDDN